MKKFITTILSLCLLFALSGCSSKSEDDILTFFNALDNTLQYENATISGSLNMNDSIMNVDMQYNQKNNLEVAAKIGLEAGGNTQDEFLSFYIKDGKTYLNSMGTKTQSTVDKIGLKKKSKLNIYNPFLDFTDDELQEFFTKTNKDGNNYQFTIDASKLSTLLDNLGSVSVESSKLEATIKNDKITHLKLSILGTQTIEETSADVDITLDINIKKGAAIEFPDDLDSYETYE